jgi:xanthine dehydrogenase YagT iron-sulfur-binding subunit
MRREGGRAPKSVIELCAGCSATDLFSVAAACGIVTRSRLRRETTERGIKHFVKAGHQLSYPAFPTSASGVGMMAEVENAPLTHRRRAILKGALAGAAMAPVLGIERPVRAAPAGTPGNLQMATVDMTVNGRPEHLTCDVRTTLLDALRNHLGLTGSKKGCDHGQCGACTVLIDGKRVLSCLTLAAMVRAPVTTIEGLAASDGTLHPMQQAFIDQDAFQCGYCTPGQIVSAVACVAEGHARTDAEIREYMSGNLCRCAAYPHIVAAINQAKMQKGKA